MTTNNPMLISRIIQHLSTHGTSTVEKVAEALKVTPGEVQDKMDEYPYIGEREPLTPWDTGTIRLAHPYPGTWLEEHTDYLRIVDWYLANYPIDGTPLSVAMACGIDLDEVTAVLINNPDTFKFHCHGFTYIPDPAEDRPTSTGVGKKSPRSVSYLVEMAERVTEVNMANGWYDEDRTFGDEIALLHSEVSEALEAYREYGLKTEVSEKGKPEGIASEFADVLIRLLDTCYRYDIDLEAEFNTKLAYNVTRSKRHGGKFL